MRILYKLDKAYISQLHKLYKEEWWTKSRTVEETKKVVDNSQIMIALVDEKDVLVGFVRVLTDYTFKAIIFDLIVCESQRGKGLGKELLSLVQTHKDLQDVKHFELYCLDEMVEFYEGFGFSLDVGDVKLMRYTITDESRIDELTKKHLN